MLLHRTRGRFTPASRRRARSRLGGRRHWYPPSPFLDSFRVADRSASGWFPM